MARVGRPLLFKNVKELQKKINAYFNKTSKKEVTITGLALYLDTSRETLMNYEKRTKFFDAIKRAKDLVQLEYEKDLRRKGRSGDIFALKNFGWKDRIETVEGTPDDFEKSDNKQTKKLTDEYEKKLKKTLTG